VPERTVFVDAENVRRSLWPNLSADELLERCSAWAAANDASVVVVYDGAAPGGVVGEVEVDTLTRAVGTRGETADDWIARAVRDAGRHVLVTSDRGLRERAGGHAERVIGGGSFARELTT
jgi:predicted RNA-binding protein with PIN domain